MHILELYYYNIKNFAGKSYNQDNEKSYQFSYISPCSAIYGLRPKYRFLIPIRTTIGHTNLIFTHY